ncbi:MAG: EamA family transporter [Actinomycetota bacterium]
MAGVLWALVAAVIWSLGNIAGAKGLSPLGVVRGTLVQLVVSTGIVAVFALAIDGVSPLLSASALALTYFAASGLFHFFAGWGFMNASIRLVGPSRMSAITGLTPLFAVLLAVITLGESLNPVIGLGVVLIVVGTYFVAVS